MESCVCPEGVIEGHLYTKEMRQKMFGVQRGGQSSLHEKYAREQIIKGTGLECPKTNVRINWRKNELVECPYPMRNENGFDYTEDFDGLQTFPSVKVWVNLKSVVGAGGSQTRTLRDECYRFVNAQLDYLVKSNATDTYFANIFDGDEAAEAMDKFRYLLGLEEYSKVCNHIYCGDLKGYFAWIRSHRRPFILKKDRAPLAETPNSS
jgi:hypothetical protein